MSGNVHEFVEDHRPEASSSALVVDLEGYEGPIDMLLALAREQKVDLLNISILHLAEQYLDFIEAARRLKLELAADYLVMAAWLAYLKSRLLLPDVEESEELNGPEMAEALAFQLRRLEAMQNAGKKIMELPRLGRDVFPGGTLEGVKVIRTPVYELTLYELLRTYGDHKSKGNFDPLEIAPTEFYSVDDALERLGGILGKIPDWTVLQGFLPESAHAGLFFKSAVASTFAASLELAKNGQLEIRQSNKFGPIFVRSRAKAG